MLRGDALNLFELFQKSTHVQNSTKKVSTEIARLVNTKQKHFWNFFIPIIPKSVSSSQKKVFLFFDSSECFVNILHQNQLNLSVLTDERKSRFIPIIPITPLSPIVQCHMCVCEDATGAMVCAA